MNLVILQAVRYRALSYFCMSSIDWTAILNPSRHQAAFYGGASNQQTYYQNDAYDGEEPAAAASGGYDAFEEREPTTASKRSSVDYQPGR